MNDGAVYRIRAGWYTGDYKHCLEQRELLKKQRDADSTTQEDKNKV